MKTHAFIFARGGSKGLIGKNIKLLNGKPLLQYSIETAKQVDRIDKVFVSTDDLEIAKVGNENGAIVIMRPNELAQDTSPEWDAWRHAIKWVEKKYGTFTGFVSLPATSPLRNSQDVISALDELNDTNSDICISVSPANRSPYFNMVTISSDSLASLVIPPKKDVSRRQDAPAVFDITTVVYASTVDFILSKNRIFDGKVCCVEVPKDRAVDIDDIYDFLLAEAILTNSDFIC
ncbi:acylneuraminate cytidylyltransferase [Gammaproteobacteria bacterium 42_54_T18]|nr:acylneuraminate cytidylyltransferase [Gammaproteobacteria bacterium 42_54_T18]